MAADATEPVAGRVVQLLTASHAGAAMQSWAEVALIPGVGIAGDRYALRTGHWSDPVWPDQELTCVSREVADALGLAPAALRRNIVVSGIDLDSLIGLDVRVGAVLVRAVRQCDPCRYLEHRVQPGLFDALRGRGGLRLRIVEAGVVRVGDGFAPA